MFAILAPILVLAAQMNQALIPQKAPKPALPKIDGNACPFEGCQFGKWTSLKPVSIYTTWKSGRKPLLTLAIGEAVTTITGIHITFEPTEIQVTAPMPEYHLKPGDKIFGYMGLGEGVFNAWFNGYWVEEFDGSGIEGLGCERKCKATLLKPGRKEWWVEIRTGKGTTGWTNDADKFEGKDSLAILQYKSDGLEALRELRPTQPRRLCHMN
jgi:hypothetical protein